MTDTELAIADLEERVEKLERVPALLQPNETVIPKSVLLEQRLAGLEARIREFTHMEMHYQFLIRELERMKKTMGNAIIKVPAGSQEKFTDSVGQIHYSPPVCFDPHGQQHETLPVRREDGPGIAALKEPKPNTSVAWLDEDLLCEDA